MLMVVAPVARIGISGAPTAPPAPLRAERPWMAMRASDGLFGFEVVFKSGFLRWLDILNPLTWASRDGLTPGWGPFRGVLR